MRFTIALVQFETAQHAPGDNLAKAERLAADAARAGADLVVFPEDFVTGPIPTRSDLADPDGRHRAAFQQLARRHAVDLVPGSVIEREGDRLYNTTYYIDRRGQVLARYRKVNLWVGEKPWCTPGEGAVVCDTRWGRTGLAICWDLAFPELFRAMLARDVAVVICPSCWCYEDAGAGMRHNPKAEVAFVDSLCVARAFENEIVLAFCNAAGAFEGSRGTCHSIGHSQVAVPFVGPAALLAHSREETLLCEVDTAILAEAEASYEIRGDLSRRPP